MANVAAHKVISKGFSNEARVVKLSWVGATDGVGMGTYTLADVEGNLMVTDAVVHVKAAVTASGAPAISIGASTTDADAMLTAAVGVKANLTLGATFKTAEAQKLPVVDGEKINLVIADAVAQTGSIDVYLTVVNR
jgi:hypothetical protein